MPLEDYAPYQPQTRCSPKAKPGTKQLSRWIVYHFDGGYGPISRPCTSGGTSEHKEGRAFDWTLDATKKADRLRAAAMLERIFRARKDGEEHVLARRMGIMYIIWNDHMYSAYDHFERARLPQLQLHDEGRLLQDAAAPQPHAHLAEPQGRPRRDQLVRRPQRVLSPSLGSRA